MENKLENACRDFINYMDSAVYLSARTGKPVAYIKPDITDKVDEFYMNLKKILQQQEKEDK
jgi:hypothetical protein